MREAIEAFLQQALGEAPPLVKVAGDASFRSYYRVRSNGESRILMDAPPDKEDSAPFVDIAAFLGRHGVPVPRVLASAPQAGLYLLDDFGDETFLIALADGGAERADLLYDTAIDTLLRIQNTPKDGACIAHQRPFDRALLRTELALFTDWYIEGIRKTPISAVDRDRFDGVFHRLLDELLRQPTVLVHRDYHCRNLMWTPEGRIGVIDFQDAVMGPVTYDLASLLRDCYVAWDAPFRRRVMARWLEGARRDLGYDPPDWARFERDFDWMAIQRNLKAVGIFGRLSLRDGKHGYLLDIPRTLGYVRETLPKYPELAELSALVDRYAPAAEAA